MAWDELKWIHHGYKHHGIMDICIMDTWMMDTCIMDTSIMDTYTIDKFIIIIIMDTCIMAVYGWLHRGYMHQRFMHLIFMHRGGQGGFDQICMGHSVTVTRSGCRRHEGESQAGLKGGQLEVGVRKVLLLRLSASLCGADINHDDWQTNYLKSAVSNLTFANWCKSRLGFF